MEHIKQILSQENLLATDKQEILEAFKSLQGELGLLKDANSKLLEEKTKLLEDNNKLFFSSTRVEEKEPVNQELDLNQVLQDWNIGGK